MISDEITYHIPSPTKHWTRYNIFSLILSHVISGQPNTTLIYIRLLKLLVNDLFEDSNGIYWEINEKY